MTIRLLLADDQALVRGAMSALLGLEPDLEVVAEVASGDAVVPAVLEHRPDVALLDVEMPGLDGISAAAEVRRVSPGTRVLIVTTFGRPGFLRRAMQSGADGFVVKDTPAAQLADAVRRVHQGLRVVDPALAMDSLTIGDSPLTERETEVFRMVADGMDTADIARELSYSERTVKNIVHAVTTRLQLRNRSHAVAYVPDVAAVALERLGPLVEHHSAFPRRVNAHFVQVHSPAEATMRTWERGSGVTLACGTGACAVCVAGVLTDRSGRKLLAHLPGGDLDLEWSTADNHVYMTGPATEVFTGDWPGDGR